MKTVRAAVVGTGWGRMHIEAFQRAGGTQVTAICDLNARRAAAVAKNARVSRFFDNYDELLRLPDVDLISVATPPNTHREMVSSALAAGKHVLCEPPLGLGRHEAAALVERAEQSGLVNAMANQTRYLPGYAYAKELIEEDYIGDLLRANVSMIVAQPWGASGQWAADDRRGGGMLTSLGIHFVDALQWWFGRIDAVMAERNTLFPQVKVSQEASPPQGAALRASADDAFVSLLRFERGGTAVLNFLSGGRQDAGWSISLYGSRGTLQITSGQLAGRREGEKEWGLIEIPRRLELPDRPREPLMWALVRLVEGVAGQVRGDKPDRPPPGFRDGLANLEVVDAIKRSSDDMLWVSV